MGPLKQHLLALGGVVIVGMPILAIDMIFFGPSHQGVLGGLDFRGWVTGMYFAVAALFWILSGVVAFAIKPRTLGCLGYAGALLVYLVLLVGSVSAFYAVTDLSMDCELAAEEEAMLEETRALERDVSLEGWSVRDGEVVLSIRSAGRARALCSWRVQGYVDEYQVGVRAEDGIDEFTCGTPGPHQTLPAGTSELRRAYQLEAGDFPKRSRDGTSSCGSRRRPG